MLREDEVDEVGLGPSNAGSETVMSISLQRPVSATESLIKLLHLTGGIKVSKLTDNVSQRLMRVC